MTPDQLAFFEDKLNQIRHIPKLLCADHGADASNLNYTIGALSNYFKTLDHRMYNADLSTCMTSILMSDHPSIFNDVMSKAYEMQKELTKEQKKSTIRAV